MPFQDIFLQWRPLRRATLYSLLGNARNLEGKSKDVDIANLSGSVAGAAGGIVSVVGLALTPVTLGASLIVTAVGLAVGIAGGVTSGGALTTDLIVNSMARKYFDRLIAQDHRATMQTQGALRQMQDVVVRFSTWESKRPEVFAQGRGLNDSIFAFIKLTKQLAYLVLKGDDCTKTALSIGRLFAVTADSGAEALTIAKSSGMGAKVASTGVRTISAASIGFAAAGLVLDVGMIGYLSYRIHTGSKNANAAEIREIRSKLQKELCVMQRVNNELEIQWTKSNSCKHVRFVVCLLSILLNKERAYITLTYPLVFNVQVSESRDCQEVCDSLCEFVGQSTCLHDFIIRIITRIQGLYSLRDKTSHCKSRKVSKPRDWTL